MKSVTLEMLYSMDFSIRFVNSLKQFWRNYKDFSQNVPKVHNNVVYLHKCSALYTLQSGETFTAHSGDVVFAPKNSLYTMRIFDLESSSACTIGINLHLYDSDGEELILSNKPFIAASGNRLSFNELFEQINEVAMDYPACLPQIYSDLYKVLYLMTAKSDHPSVLDSRYASIAKAIIHLRCEDAYTMKIADMAKECHVSESYLRRQFKKYSGMSPVTYIRLRKIMAAKNLLRYSDMSMDEIAYNLNFTDAAYFCKVFHRDTGMTPKQYRRQEQK